MNKRLSNKKGITLVALIITIIVLLILAGVSIMQLTESGLFEKARAAEQKTENSKIKEELILADYENKIGQYVEGTREQVMVDKEEYTQLLSRVEALESKSDSSELLSRIEALEAESGSLEGIGEYYISNFSNAKITTGQSNAVSSITLPAGKYILVGFAGYEGSNLRYYVSLAGASSSAYDNMRERSYECK